MENLFFYFLSVLVLAILYVTLVFSHFDRKQFRIERMILAHKKKLEEWLRACGEIEPGCARGYDAAARNRERMACLCELAKTIYATSDTMLELQSQLADFCLHYNRMVRSYNKTLKLPLIGRTAKLLRFRAYAELEFVVNEAP